MPVSMKETPVHLEWNGILGLLSIDLYRGKKEVPRGFLKNGSGYHNLGVHMSCVTQ